MKRIFKLFPVAVAAFALASCSNDDFFGNGETFELASNQMIVEVDEGDTDVTRAAFAEGTSTTTGKLSRSLLWLKGDAIKLYDTEANWRPQIWTHNADASVKYVSSTGISAAVFETATAVREGDAMYTNGYGVFPANLGEFTNEGRTKLSFDLTGLRSITYKADAATVDGLSDATAYVGPTPLWGVKTNANMKVKYLTGFLRIDINGLTASTNNRYLFITSDKKITGKFEVTGFDPEDLTKAPLLKTAKTASANQAPTNAVVMANCVPGNETYDNLIVVNLGKAAGLKVVYVPIPMVVDDVKHTINAWLTKDVALAANVDLTNAGVATKIIDDEQLQVEEAGKFYKYGYDGAVYAGGSLSGLKEQIEALDAAAARASKLSVTGDVSVTSSDLVSANYLLNLNLTHDITVEFAATKGFKGTAADQVLMINNSGTGKLTIINNNTTLDPVIRCETLASDLILKGSYTTINVTDSKMIVAGTTTTVNAKTATVNIDAPGSTITTLNVYPSCTQLNLNNGKVSAIAFPEALTSDLAIATNGDAEILSIGSLQTTVAGKHLTTVAGKGQKVIDITAKWDGNAPAASALGVATDGTNHINNVVYTATQLLKVAAAGDAATIMAKEIDLDGKDWAGVALTKSIDGNYSGATTPVQAEIKGLGTKAADLTTGKGLFTTIISDANLTVQNLKLTGVAMTATTGSNIGALAGKVSCTATGKTITFKNIDVAGAITASGAASNIGGVVGKVAFNTAAGTVKFDNVNVGTMAITGYTALGGIVGLVDEKTIVNFAGTAGGGDTNVAQTCSSNATFTSVSNGGNTTAPAYAGIGKFIGTIASSTTAADKATVTLYLNALPVAKGSVAANAIATPGYTPTWYEVQIVEGSLVTTGYPVRMTQQLMSYPEKR